MDKFHSSRGGASAPNVLPGESASGWRYLSTHYVVVAWSGTGPSTRRG